MSKFNRAEFDARTAHRVDVSAAKAAIDDLPGKAAAHAVDAAAANSVPALREVVARQSQDIAVLSTVVSYLLKSEGY